jgi:hypothetical protein
MVECPAGKLVGFFMRFTIRDLIWLTVVAAVVLAAFFVQSNRPTRWEYRIEYGGQNLLNNVGAEGWELVDVVALPHDGGVAHYLKRPKSN